MMVQNFIGIATELCLGRMSLSELGELLHATSAEKSDAVKHGNEVAAPRYACAFLRQFSIPVNPVEKPFVQ